MRTRIPDSCRVSNLCDLFMNYIISQKLICLGLMPSFTNDDKHTILCLIYLAVIKSFVKIIILSAI